VLYNFRHASSPFCFGYLGDRVPIFAQASLHCDSPILSFPQSGMTGTCHHVQLLVEMGSHELLAWSDFELWSSWFQTPSS
jgi:hypothetical protein